jgi:outer membrane protein assembly factor BamB
MPIWGISASPLIAHNLIVTQVGGKDGACIVAVDAKSGKNVWKALQERAQYSAPILIRQSNRDVVVVWTGDSISGLDLPTGQVLWHVDFPVSRMPIGVATPVVNGDRIFVTSFYDGSMMVQFDPNELTAKKLWHEMGPDEQHTKALHSIISTPVFEGDHIYGVDSYGELRCLDAKTGKRIWEDRTATPRDRWSTIHFVQRNGHTWMLNEAGDLIVANLTPKGYEELSRSHLLMPTQAQLSRRGGKGVCWSHPAFANRHIYARNDQELICASLAI